MSIKYKRVKFLKVCAWKIPHRGEYKSLHAKKGKKGEFLLPLFNNAREDRKTCKELGARRKNMQYGINTVNQAKFPTKK